VELARKMWDIRPTQLPTVCRRLSIELKHHEALSDAEACGRIVLAALKSGWKPDPALLQPGTFQWSSGAPN
jgi:DNA polymerase-3 subunit epsilon